MNYADQLQDKFTLQKPELDASGASYAVRHLIEATNSHGLILYIVSDKSPETWMCVTSEHQTRVEGLLGGETSTLTIGTRDQQGMNISALQREFENILREASTPPLVTADNHIARWKELEEHPERMTSSRRDMNNIRFKVPGGYSRKLNTQNKEYMNPEDPEDVSYFEFYDKFYKDVDDAIIEARYTLEEIQTLVAHAETSETILDTLHRKLLPVYQILRKKGYTHHEIIK